jgi:hypothetical protein
VREGEPGWFYVGNGQLRYKDGQSWTDQYRDIDQIPAPQPMLSPSSAPESSGVHRGRSTNHVALFTGSALIVVLAAIGIYLLGFRPLPTAVSWAQSVSAIAPGDYLTISGQVTPAERGRQILLESASGPQGQWQLMRPGSVTDSRGRFAITFKPQISKSVAMRVVVDPAGRLLQATGASRPLRLLSLSRISLTGKGMVLARAPLKLTIDVSPPSTGRTVTIQESSDGLRWAPIGSSTRTTGMRTSLVDVPNPDVGVWSYRATVAPNDKFAGAVSPPMHATVRNFKTAAGTYLDIVNEWNAAKFSFMDVHGRLDAQGEVPSFMRAAAGVFSSACTREVARLGANHSWPRSVNPLIKELTTQKVVMADTLGRLSATRDAASWRTLLAQSVVADNEGRSLSGLIRVALGLPAQATTGQSAPVAV